MSAGEPSTVAEALQRVGHGASEPPRRPVLRHGDATLVTLATFGADGRPVWHALWWSGGKARAIGPAVPASSLGARAGTSAGARSFLDLAAASYRSLLERLETLGGRLDALEAAPAPPTLAELSGLQRELAQVRKHLFRLELLLADLEGPLGVELPGVGAATKELGGPLERTAELASGLQQAARDLVALRNATEANRLAEAANALGATSNRIATMANTSNLRMLSVAYVALALALISAVVLIPNTAATILGMPSAAWVPGLWVDVALVGLAIVPALVVFSRPWVRRMLSGWGSYEQRSAEGVADLPELTDGASRPPRNERLRQGPP
jgi:hypothetical protein